MLSDPEIRFCSFSIFLSISLANFDSLLMYLQYCPLSLLLHPPLQRDIPPDNLTPKIDSAFLEGSENNERLLAWLALQTTSK